MLDPALSPVGELLSESSFLNPVGLPPALSPLLSPRGEYSLLAPVAESGRRKSATILDWASSRLASSLPSHSVRSTWRSLMVDSLWLPKYFFGGSAGTVVLAWYLRSFG